MLSLASLVVVTGCSNVIEKSANPLSPTIAGPLDGVTFTAPVNVTPVQNAQIKYGDQPVTFAFDTASSSGPRPFTMHLQVASDYAFTKIAFDRGGFEKPSSGNRISFRLPDRLPKSIYYWRVRAEDGANNSDWSAPAAFEALEQIVIGRPTPDSPRDNERVTSRNPTLNADNGATSGPHKAVQYQFQVSTSSSFSSLAVDGVTGMGIAGNETHFGMPIALAYDTTYNWRVRASDGEVTSDWSTTATFRTPLAPVVAPPSGGGGGGNGGGCTPIPRNGPAVIACVGSRYPEKLAGGVSSSQRHANMEFLRDRIIETGLCGGMNLGWNLKRGGPDLSTDFISHRQSGGDMGVDIGFDFDNTSTTLVLVWAEWGEFGASHKAYSNSYSCSSSAALEPAPLTPTQMLTNLFERVFTR